LLEQYLPYRVASEFVICVGHRLSRINMRIS
jgi:hypothetical protein